MIDLNKWYRGKLFQFYIDKMRIVMSLTVDIDVTNLKQYSKKNSIDFFKSRYSNYFSQKFRSWRSTRLIFEN